MDQWGFERGTVFRLVGRPPVPGQLTVYVNMTGELTSRNPINVTRSDLARSDKSGATYTLS